MTWVIIVCLVRTNGSLYWGFGPGSRKKNHVVPEARQPKHNREAKLKNGGQSLAERSLTRWPESLADISCT